MIFSKEISMRVLLFAVIIISWSSLLAQEETDCADITPSSLKPVIAVKKALEPTCPNDRDLEFLCTDVNFRTEDGNSDKRVKYAYQRKVLQAACVNVESDSDADMAKKISVMWTKYEEKLTCNSLQFDIPNGTLLKFAVSSKFDNFLKDAVKWKINLNRVDPVDKRTVLDYIKDTMEASPGSATAAKLKFYYDILRKAGAKHKSEL